MKNNKTCAKCTQNKNITEFYKHIHSKDGYLNKCKACKIEEAKLREKKLREKPEWVDKEKKRLRDNYFKINEVTIWKQIEEFQNYSISDNGLVKNNKTNRILKPQLNSYGYLCVKLNNSKPYIHRLIGKTFILKDNELQTQVDHIDRNPLNNHISNLRWVTPQENIDNRGVFNKTGLYYDELSNKWVVQIKEKNRLMNLGSFETIEGAYDKLRLFFVLK